MADSFVPVTFVADELLTSTKMNLLAANQAGFHDGTALGDGIIVTRHLGTGTNLRVPAANILLGAQDAIVAANESTSSNVFTDMPTVGPSVTVNVPASGVLLVVWRAQFPTGPMNMSPQLSGANTYTAQQNDALFVGSLNTNAVLTSFKLFTGLNAGNTTVTMKYKSDSGTSTVLRRYLIAIPLGQ